MSILPVTNCKREYGLLLQTANFSTSANCLLPYCRWHGRNLRILHRPTVSASQLHFSPCRGGPFHWPCPSLSLNKFMQQRQHSHRSVPAKPAPLHCPFPLTYARCVPHACMIDFEGFRGDLICMIDCEGYRGDIICLLPPTVRHTHVHQWPEMPARTRTHHLTRKAPCAWHASAHAFICIS